MGFFTKTEPEKKVETETTKKGETPMPENPTSIDIAKEYPYVVQLNDIHDSTIIRRKPFGAKRYIEGANVYLVNEKVGFKEPFPENGDIYKQYKLEEIETIIDNIQNKLNTIKVNKRKNNKSNKTAEELDLEVDLKTYKGFKRSIELQGTGSYAINAEEYGGRILFTFDRKGNFKLPVFKNVDYSLLYIPNEADITLAGDLLKLNDQENGNKDNMLKLANVVVLVLMVIGFIALLYFIYKTASIPQVFVEGMPSIIEGLNDLTQNLESLTDKFNESINVEAPDIDSKINPSTINVNNK